MPRVSRQTNKRSSGMGVVLPPLGNPSQRARRTIYDSPRLLIRGRTRMGDAASPHIRRLVALEANGSHVDCEPDFVNVRGGQA